MRVTMRLALSGRYQFPDGAMRIQFDPGEIVRIPITFAAGTNDKRLAPGQYDVYFELASEPAGHHRLEVGLADAIGEIEYERSDGRWLGPVHLNPRAATASVDIWGDAEHTLVALSVLPRGAVGPQPQTSVVPSDEQALWIDLPDRMEQIPWFEPGIAVRARIRAHVRGTYSVSCTTLDFHHREVASTAYSGKGNTQRIIDLRVPPAFGPYLVRCRATARGSAPREYQLSVARAALRPPMRSALLGGHGNPDLLAAMGAGWYRHWETGGTELTWHEVEPAPGHFVFRDPEVHGAFQHVGVLDGPPAWGATSPGAWSDYVSAVVGHYRGRIAVWEIFNERYGDPDVTQARDYVSKVNAIVERIRTADPTSRVASGGPPRDLHGGARWWQVLGEAGLFEKLDIITAHLYVADGGQRPLDEDVALHAYIGTIRQILDAHGAADKPLWDTESGIGPNESFYIGRSVTYGFWDAMGFHAHTALPYAVGAAMGARLLAVHAWNRVPWFVYQPTATYGNAWALVDFDESPLPVALAIAQMTKILDGYAPERAPALPPGVFGLSFARGDDAIAAVWAIGIDPAQTRSAVLPEAMELRDMWGNPLGAQARLSLGIEPVLITGSRRAVDEALAAMRAGQ